MSRQRTEINPVRAERLKTLIDREKIKQSQLADMIFQSQQNISRIVQQKQPLTEETARDIINAVNQATGKDYRIEWLLAYDDIMTRSDFHDQFISSYNAQEKAIDTILFAALKNVCIFEGIEQPTLDAQDYAFLRAQLIDAADSIAWNFTKKRQERASSFWGLLDQLDQKVSEKLKQQND